MTREQLEAYFTRKGLIKDRFGHFKTKDGNTRYKMQARSVRKERKATTEATQYSPKKNFWVRVAGANYSQLSITADDLLAGMTVGYRDAGTQDNDNRPKGRGVE